MRVAGEPVQRRESQAALTPGDGLLHRFLAVK
jgi:hypothetical protein